MLFRKATLLFFITFVASIGIAASNDGDRVLKKDSSTKAPKTKKRKNHAKVNVVCVAQADAERTVGVFTDIVVQISQAYIKGTETSVEVGCLAAYDLAFGALRDAYAYNLDKVLFKPTYSTVPHSYRNTLPGALSYFIGTECVNIAAPVKHGHVFPEGNSDGSLFQEYGFGLNTQRDGRGWKSGKYTDFTYFTGKPGEENCLTALALGRICFENGKDETSCVDKTFSFMNGNTDIGQLPAIFTSHHSSATINTSPTSIATCQNPPNADDPGVGGFPSSIVPNITACV
mmetsp:Transcript_5970/g.12500  ORF Transcript_5970/g.12500 Transcript_5970/m.12500 type:complete len:287 (+) Transcript_5970:80-940(+)